MKEMARNVDGFGINDMISDVKKMVSQANQHLASILQPALECRWAFCSLDCVFLCVFF